MNYDSLMWSKSSYSDTQGGACVEIAATPTAIHVRDSKDQTGPHLTFTPTAWSAFLTHAAALPVPGP